MEHEFTEDVELYARAASALSQHGFCPVVLQHHGAAESFPSLGYLPYPDLAFLQRFTRTRTAAPRVLIDPRGLDFFAVDDGVASEDRVMWDRCRPPDRDYTVFAFRKALHAIGLEPMFTHILGQKRPTMAEWYTFLGSAKYVVSLSHRQYSAGQVIAEAAVMGIVVFSLAQRHHQRVLMPEFCFVQSPYEVFLKISFLERASADPGGECVADARYRELQDAIAKNVKLYLRAPDTHSLEMQLWHSLDHGHADAQSCVFPRSVGAHCSTNS
jgi:hypothetical protein